MSNESELEAESHRPPLRVAIVGLGRAALFNHLPALKSLPRLYQVTAVCDLLRERRAIVEQDYPKVHTYRRVEDMLDDPEIDLVDIALPSLDHQDAALESLNREKYTLVETPLALTHDAATVLKAASQKARGRLFAYTPGMFSPEFRLAKAALDNPSLGDIYDIRVRQQDYVRRDDWQSVKRCGGGAAWYAGTDAILQAVALMRAQPTQLWSELKRVAALGDAEDFAHIVLKSRGEVTADIEINGGNVMPLEPALTIRGSRGAFFVAPGAKEGVYRVIDPGFRFPRRRSSVRTPPLDDMHENFEIKETAVSLPPDADSSHVALWKALYATIRTAEPFPVALDDVVEAIRYLQLVKRASPFAK